MEASPAFATAALGLLGRPSPAPRIGGHSSSSRELLSAPCRRKKSSVGRSHFTAGQRRPPVSFSARAQLDVDVAAPAAPVADRERIHGEVYEELQRGEDMSLARVAALIESAATGADAAATLAALDDLAEGAREHAPPSPYPMRVLAAARRYVYDELGFTTSREHRSPAAAYLSTALERRAGYTAPLSLLFAAVCERMGLPLQFASMPGPFLLRPRAALDEDEAPELFVDGAKGGAVLFRHECRQRYRAMLRDAAAPLPDWLLEPEAKRRTLFRYLRSAKSVHLARCELAPALSAAELLVLVDPSNACERRDRGLLRFALATDLDAARTDLLMYAGQCARVAPGSRERAMVLEAADRVAALGRSLSSQPDEEERLALVRMLAPHPAQLARTLASLPWADYSGTPLPADDA